MNGPGNAKPETPQLEGTTLDGRYLVETVIGHGGMGAVYCGRQTRLNKRIAIKVLRSDLTSDPVHVRRFLLEAQAASMVSHRNVVDVIDCGEDAGRVYFVMEYLEGVDLAWVIQHRAPMPWVRVKSLLFQMIRGLKAVHAAGLVHRDVKPANFFLVNTPQDEPDDWLKVLDFGIAKLTDPTFAAPGGGLTSTSQVLGTAMYMAPEQAMGRPVDARTDVYAIGLTVFEMLTGRKPFSGETAFELMMKRVNEPPPRAGAWVPGLSGAIEAVLERAMAQDPNDRFQDMRELEDAVYAIDGDPRPMRTSSPRDTEPGRMLSAPTLTSARSRPVRDSHTNPDTLVASSGPGGTQLYRHRGGGAYTDTTPASTQPPVPSPAADPLDSSPATSSGRLEADAMGSGARPRRAVTVATAGAATLVLVLGTWLGVRVWEGDSATESSVAQLDPFLDVQADKGRAALEPPIPRPVSAPVVHALDPKPGPGVDSDQAPPSIPEPKKPPLVAPRPQVSQPSEAVSSRPSAHRAVSRTTPRRRSWSAGFARKMKKACPGDHGHVVKLKYRAVGGRALMVSDAGSDAPDDVIQCVKRKLREATLPDDLGGDGYHNVQVEF